jgi:hypothetical protein
MSQSNPATLTLGPGTRTLPDLAGVRTLILDGAWDPSDLLVGLSIFKLSLVGCQMQALPEDLRVTHELDCSNCTALRELPAGLDVPVLRLGGCLSLERLPEGLTCHFLDLTDCTGFNEWPARGQIDVGRVTLRGCGQLRNLPNWFGTLSQLDLRDCANLRKLPDGLRVTSWIDIAGTRVRSLPESLADVPLRWRGVAVDQRIAFDPETITAEEILAEPNAERRRVMLERMGYDAFLNQAHAEVLDTDTDPGGERRLFKVPMEGDEDLVCVSVLCPSTARQYVIRVPPTTATCHAAAAWIAGFDDPTLYNPLVET